MKKVILLVALISIFACKKEADKTDEPGIMDAVDGIQNLNKATDAIKDYEKKIEELKNLKPIASEVFKEVLPENIGDLKRSSYTAGATAMIGLMSGEAMYGDASGKTFKVTIFDGAGESGSAMLAMQHMALSMDTESIEGTNTKKNQEIDGERCLTENDTNPAGKRSNITFIHNDRFHVTFEGNLMDLDELKTFMTKLDLSKLN